MLVKGFWEQLERPIIGLAPMDGVTDAAFRYITCKHSQPSLTMTEFTNVEGLARGAEKMLVAFLYNEIERPVVAQIYGIEVESFYKCTVMLAALGFDGVDINMGCPANKVARRGSGAALIQTPELAKKIVLACKRGARDWANGISLKEAGVHENLIKFIEEHPKHKIHDDSKVNPGSKNSEENKSFARLKKTKIRHEIPISVKTRIGFDQDVAEEWTKHLIEVQPANISMHGRTLRQMYMGKASWEAISRAGKVCKIESGGKISFLGNGDILNLKQAKEQTKKYNLDGVLIGRATMGNPWFFNDSEPILENLDQESPQYLKLLQQRLNVCLEHSALFAKMNHLPFYNLRKHLAWYCKGFEGAKELRRELMKVDEHEDVMGAVKDFFDRMR